MRNSNLGKSRTETVFDADDIVQVLALDGGGLKGVYTASVIKALEDKLGDSVCNHFDIVTGTSTGGLIALALGCGISGDNIQKFYLENAETIFPSSGFVGFLRMARTWVSSRYSNKDLEELLKSLLVDAHGNQQKLGDSRCRLVIPTFQATDSLPRLMKTPHDARYRYDWKLPMWAVGMATSAAPTYLPAYTYDSVTYLDGGLWANNPSMVGVVEAKDLGADLANVRLLNIGTTFSSSQVDTQSWFFDLVRIPRSGYLGWATQIYLTLMEANSFSTASMYVHQLLEKGSFICINDEIPTEKDRLDKVDCNYLVELGEKAGEKHYLELQQLFDYVAKSYLPVKEAME